MENIIKQVSTGHQREFTLIEGDGANLYLKVQQTTHFGGNGYIRSFLSQDKAIELGTALLEAAGHQVTYTPDELPKVVEGWNDNRLHSNNVGANLTDDPKMVMKKALGLIAIAKELEKRQAEAVERNKAEAKAEKEREEKLNKRRNALARELTGIEDIEYAFSTVLSQKAIDRIIELEDSSPQVPF